MYASAVDTSSSSPLRDSEEDANGKDTIYPANAPLMLYNKHNKQASSGPGNASVPATAAYKAYKGAQKHHQQNLQNQQQQQQKSKLQFQTLVFKVQVHCDACIKKVKKAIAQNDGVESITVDLNQKRVTVTGHIDQKKLLKKVAKTGKQVELVTGKDSGNGNKNSSNLVEKPLMPMDTHAKMMMMSSSSSSSIFPTSAEDTFMFSDENVNSCSIM